MHQIDRSGRMIIFVALYLLPLIFMQTVAERAHRPIGRAIFECANRATGPLQYHAMVRREAE